MAKVLSEFPNLSGRYVLLRTCYDLPIDVSKPKLDPQRVEDDARIRDSIQTIQFLVEKKAKIIMEPGWMGRPKGQDPELSMACAVLRLRQILTENRITAAVKMVPDSLDGSAPRSVYRNKQEVADAAAALKPGEILMLENSRFDAEENANDENFGAFLAQLAGKGALYVNEAEASNHRPCASVTVTPIKVAANGGEACLGFHYADAVKYIGGITTALAKPGRGKFVFFLTGKKIETAPGITSKITVANGLMEKMLPGDAVIVQGGVSYTFLVAQFYEHAISDKQVLIEQVVGKYNSQIKQIAADAKKSALADASKQADIATTELEKQKSSEILGLTGIDEKGVKDLVGGSYIEYKQLGEQMYFAWKLIVKAKSRKVKMITALDHVVTDMLPNKSGVLPDDAKIGLFSQSHGIPAGMLGVAPGPLTLSSIKNEVEDAAIVLLAGPIAIEDPRVEQIYKVHELLFKSIGIAKANGAITVAAGGDTASTVARMNAQDDFTIVSNAGGATLELIEKGTSPGLEAVEKANEMAEKR